MSNAMTRENLIETLSSLTLLEAADLVKALEEAWGVSAAAAVAVAGPAVAGASAEAAEEQSEYKITLVKGSDKKIDLIKEIRALTGLGLKEAKDVAEGENVVVKEGLSKKDAEEMKKKLESVGAQVSMS